MVISWSVSYIFNFFIQICLLINFIQFRKICCVFTTQTGAFKVRNPIELNLFILTPIHSMFPSRDMEDHVQKFRKTKSRARQEFDQIVSEHTKKLEEEVFDLEKELKSMEERRAQKIKTKERAKELDNVVKEHQVKESKDTSEDHSEDKSDKKSVKKPTEFLSPMLSILAIFLGVAVAGFLFKSRTK